VTSVQYLRVKTLDSLTLMPLIVWSVNEEEVE
jgi:hypothetical protein